MKSRLLVIMFLLSLITISFPEVQASAAEINWSFSTDGRVWSDINVGPDGTVYFGSHDNYTYALWPNGTLKWKYDLEGIVWTKSMLDSYGRVYTHSKNDTLYVFNSDGTVNWTFTPGGDLYGLSVAISSDDTVYFPAENQSSDNSLFAFFHNGTLKWNLFIEEDIASDPSLNSEETIHFGTYGGAVYAVYPNGTVKWKFVTSDDVLGAPSFDSSGNVYFSSYFDFYALWPNGTLKWLLGPNTWVILIYGPAVGGDDIIYSCFDWYGFTALWPNGTIKWRFSENLYGCDSKPSIGKDGTIYMGYWNNYTYALFPNGTQRWKIYIPGNAGNTAVSDDNIVYSGSRENKLYAIQETNPPPSTSCGDDVCSGSENSTDCCDDCGCPTNYWCDSNVCKPLCRDYICTTEENYTTCCWDCACPAGYKCLGTCTSTCGDSECNYGENSTICCDDCGCPQGLTCVNDTCVAVCGDSTCHESEDCSSCPADCLGNGQVCCGSVAYTGDCCSESDCTVSYSCSNNVCTAPPPPPPTSPPAAYCGDGSCNGNENCDLCPTDCECAPGYYCCDGVCEPPDCSSDSECGDDESCTTDLCIGIGCNAYCSNANVTECLDDDNCCPTGCGSLNDTDCVCTDKCVQGEYKCELNLTYSCVNSTTGCLIWSENQTCSNGCCNETCCDIDLEEMDISFEINYLFVGVAIGIISILLVIVFLFTRI